jgi:hypothetical protein
MNENDKMLLTKIDTKLEILIKQYNTERLDVEKRIRFLEKYAYLMIGGTALLSSVLGAIIKVVVTS